MSSTLPPGKLDDFREVVLIDSEFVAAEGERQLPVALVAQELRSGRRHELFFDEAAAHNDNPLPNGDDVLYVAYGAQAEWGTFLSLGWELPTHVLDLYAEFRCITNGFTGSDGCAVSSSLIDALIHYGLDAMTVVHKEAMRNLVLRGHPYTVSERRDILEYCSDDVAALERLLPVMLRSIDLPFALFRGRYSKAVARMEASGIPMDVPTLYELKRNWQTIKQQLILDVEAEHHYGAYEGFSWSDRRFGAFLERIGILDEWPRTGSGRLQVDDDLFKTMATRHPVLQPLRDLRSTLVHLRDLKVTVGSDGRNRCSLMPFRSKTGRNYPPSSKFMFGPSTWLRSLIKPEPDRAVAYIDWVSAEFGIAAALSGDPRMLSAYESGDVYMAFAIEAGAAPAGATKLTHARQRELYKLTTLAVQYGQGAAGLATTLGIAHWEAQELLDLHRRVFPTYWDWIEWNSQRAAFVGTLETVFRWPLRITDRTKPNTISNFPMQAHGAEMLRWGCTFATERGIEVHAPVQDALLVGGACDEIDDVVEETCRAMDDASEIVLDGFALKTESHVVRYPDRYMDKRGVTMWNRVNSMLNLNGVVA